MVRLACIALVALAAGCVDTTKCHVPVDWKPCAGSTAEPGSSGSPPTIVELSIPTCAYLSAPSVKGTLRASDPDGDAQVVKFALYTGEHNNEAEIQLDDAGRSGNDWIGEFTLVVSASAGGMLMEGSSDIQAKVTDRAGAQSVTFCNSIALVR